MLLDLRRAAESSWFLKKLVSAPKKGLIPFSGQIFGPDARRPDPKSGQKLRRVRRPGEFRTFLAPQAAKFPDIFFRSGIRHLLGLEGVLLESDSKMSVY